jgi:replicative DNA helicase
VVALSQLNRKADTRTDRHPELSDLRESGEIEAHAAVVVLLHREDAYDRESPRAGEIDLIVAKNRNGPCATITAAFQGEYARIMDMAPERPRERPLERGEVADLDARRRLK